MILQLIVILLTALLAVLFTFQNPHNVQMHFMAWQTQQFPVIAVILISMLTGVIVTAVLSLKSNLGLNKRIRELQSEVNKIKNGSANTAPTAGKANQQDGFEDLWPANSRKRERGGIS